MRPVAAPAGPQAAQAMPQDPHARPQGAHTIPQGPGVRAPNPDRRRWCARAATGLVAGLGLGLGQGPAWAWSPGTATAGPALGSLVQWPAVQLLDGTRLQPAAAAGQAWVVVFFATWCPYCLRHNTRLQALMPQLQQRGVQVLAAAHDRQPELVRRYLQVHRLHLPVTLDEAPLHQALSPRRVTPLTCVVDHQGRLAEVIPGEMTDSDLSGLARWGRS